jgi:hypothetical protein
MVPYEIRNLKFEGVEILSDQIITFEDMKKGILEDIEKEDYKHLYYEIKNKIEESQTIEELTELMDSVPH